MHMLEEENASPKRLVVDITLDQHVLQEVLRTKSETDPPTRTRPCGIQDGARSGTKTKGSLGMSI